MRGLFAFAAMLAHNPRVASRLEAQQIDQMDQHKDRDHREDDD